MIRCTLMMLIVAAVASPCVRAAEVGAEDSVEVQAAREKWVKNKGYQVHYTKKFDLSDLPHYKPEQKASGTIRMWGSNYFTDSPLADYWMEQFHEYQPDVKFALHLKTTLHAIPGLIFGVSDVGPMGRQITWDELLSYQRERNHLPLGIVAVTGSYDVSGWNPPIGVYLHKDIRCQSSPCSSLTVFLGRRVPARGASSPGTSRSPGGRKRTSAPGASSVSPASGPTSRFTSTATTCNFISPRRLNRGRLEVSQQNRTRT